MDKIIGIGGTGCAIAEKFRAFPQYEIFKIDTDLKGENCYSVPRLNTPEDYERYNYDLPEKFKNISGDILVILSGTGNISGGTLKILYNLKHCNINVLYIKPDNIMNGNAKLQGRLTMGVLQEYARSGIFKRIFLVDNEKLDAIIGNVPIIGYYDVLNDMIVNTMHQINKSQHIKPIVNQASESKIGCRIYTIGLFSIENSVESLFFDLKDISEKCYYFHYNRDALKSDGTLFRKIRDIIKSQTSDSLKTGFAIYSTEFNTNFCFVTACTSQIQSC
jgi:hypothetical protein